MGGADKSLLPLAGRPILAHVIERLGPQLADLVIVANGDLSRFAAFGLPVVADRVAGHAGPLAGIHAGIAWAKANRPGSQVRDLGGDRHPVSPHRSRQPLWR